MGFIREAIHLKKMWKAPEFVKAMEGPRGQVSMPFSEAGGVRFSSKDVGGELDRYVLLYAEPRGDGVYDVAAMCEKDFDSQELSGMRIGMLDHVPLDGEHVVGWIPEEVQSSFDAQITAQRARGYMAANGFRVWYSYFTVSKDGPYYEPIKPLRDSIPPIGEPVPFLAPKPGETLVVCNVAPGRVVEHAGGLAARVPCDAGGDGTVFLAVEPGEVADDPWHDGMRALFLRNTAARPWWHAGADGLPDGEALAEDTGRAVAHVKLQEQINRDAGLTAWGEPAGEAG